MADVVVVGVGRIGLPVIADLVGAGHHVRAVDVREDRRAAVSAVGARWAGTSVGTVQAAEVLITVLPGSPELRALMLGEGSDPGLLRSIAAGSTWIDLTSAAPDLGAELAHAAQRSGVDYLDAPLGGGVRAAEGAELTLYVGGPIAVLDRQRPLLQALARPGDIHHVGDHGSGYLTKLLVNQLWFTTAVAVAEALLLGQRAGLPPALLRDIIEASPASSRFVVDYVRPLLDGDYVAEFGLDRVVEELDSLVRLAQDTASPFEVSAQVASLHRKALAHFGPVAGELMAVAYLEHRAERALRH